MRISTCVLISILIAVAIGMFMGGLAETHRRYHGMVKITEYKPDNSMAHDGTYSHLWPEYEPWERK